MPTLTIRKQSLAEEPVPGLIAALNAELSDRYPEDGANFFHLDPGEVVPGHGAFLVAWMDGLPVGCGAVRLLVPGVVEIKRMYVTPESRGLGVGRDLLAALEVEARDLGATRIVLETGDRQPEAIALYTSAGFDRIPPFGEYTAAPLSVYMAKDLDPPEP